MHAFMHVSGLVVGEASCLHIFLDLSPCVINLMLLAPVHTPHTCILPCKFGPALLFAMDRHLSGWVTLPPCLLAWQWQYRWPWPRDDDDLVRAFYSGLREITSKRISQLTPEDMAHLRAGAAKLTSQHFGVELNIYLQFYFTYYYDLWSETLPVLVLCLG